MKKIVLAFVMSLVPLTMTSAQTKTFVASYSPATWSSSTAYALNDLSTLGSGSSLCTYISLVSSNLNNSPASTLGVDWNVVGCASGGGGGSGTVTSVGLTLPSIFAVTGSPVTASGTITATFLAQTANTFFRGPASGAAAVPTFGPLVLADLPTAIPNANLQFSSTTVNGTVCTLGASCTIASSGSGTVTSFAAGTWPSWLVPTVTNATTTPSLAVAASAIPNGALANSSVTVNGTNIPLGGTATITASTPNALTFAATGGAAPGSTYTGATALTVSAATVGADASGAAAAIAGTQTTNYIPLWNGTALASSFLDQGVTATGQITASEPFGEQAAGVFSTASSYTGINTNINTCNAASLYNTYYQPGKTYVGGLTGCVTGDTTGNDLSTEGVLGIASSGNAATEPVGGSFYGTIQTGASGVHAFGINPLVSDHADSATGKVLFGGEFDTQPFNAPSAYTATVGAYIRLYNPTNNGGTYPGAALQIGAGTASASVPAYWAQGINFGIAALCSSCAALYTQALNTAVGGSGTNYGGPPIFNAFESYDNGTTAVKEGWGLTPTIDAGANPANDYLTLSSIFTAPTGQVHHFILNNNVLLQLNGSSGNSNLSTTNGTQLNVSGTAFAITDAFNTSTGALAIDPNATGSGSLLTLDATGASTNNDYIAVDNGRTFFGFNGSNGNALIQAAAAKGIGFAQGGTFGATYVALIDPTGNFGIGSSVGTVASDPFNVTAAGAVTGTSYTTTGAVNSATLTTTGAASIGTTLTVDPSAATSGALVTLDATGASGNSDYIAIDNSRSFFGYYGATGNTMVQSAGGTGKGIGFAENATYGSGLVGIFDQNGNFGVGTSASNATADTFYVTAAGAVTGGAFTGSSVIITGSVTGNSLISATSIAGVSETLSGALSDAGETVTGGNLITLSGATSGNATLGATATGSGLTVTATATTLSGTEQVSNTGTGLLLSLSPGGASTDNDWASIDGRVYAGFNGSNATAVLQGVSKNVGLATGSSFGTGYDLIGDTSGNVGIGASLNPLNDSFYSTSAGVVRATDVVYPIGTAVASASTITPSGMIFHVTGTNAISTMTPFAIMTSSPAIGATFVLIADAAWTIAAGTGTGQFKSSLTAVAGVPYQCTYDGTLWYCK